MVTPEGNILEKRPSLTEQDVRVMYQKEIEDPLVTPALAAIKTLSLCLEREHFTTLQEVDKRVQNMVEYLVSVAGLNRAQVTSACRFFLSAISYRTLEENNLLSGLRSRAKDFEISVSEARAKVAQTAHTFINDDMVILIHSYSRAVLSTLREALDHKKRFTVYVTKCSPTDCGKRMADELEKLKLSCTLIPDSSIGYFMELVDIVMVGAECVAKNGGIINRLGSYPIAVCAKTINKPLYVCCEKYKFSDKLYPLSQRDVRKKIRTDEGFPSDDFDYTPPEYITLLLTDLGPLPTAAVTDVLIWL